MADSVEKSGQPAKAAYWVEGRFSRCEKMRYRGGQPGRYYPVVFVTTTTTAGGPPVGSEVVSVVSGKPGKLFDAAGKQNGLVNAMQALSRHLHSPEQLMTEHWDIETRMKVVEDPDGTWKVIAFGTPDFAIELPAEPAAPATAARPPAPATGRYDEAATRDHF